MNLIMYLSNGGEPNPDGGGSPSFLIIDIKNSSAYRVTFFISNNIGWNIDLKSKSLYICRHKVKNSIQLTYK